MRWSWLGLIAACAGETGVVHDGDTDIVLIAQHDEGYCGDREPAITVEWPIPDGARDITVSLCVREYVDDTDSECTPRPAEDLPGLGFGVSAIGEDGILRFKCGGYYVMDWRIDYLAPRP